MNNELNVIRVDFACKVTVFSWIVDNLIALQD
jgi:hypothetical protein